MKILQVCNKPPYPPHDGGSLAMFNMARSLTELGHSVTILTMYTRKHKYVSDLPAELKGRMKLQTCFVDTSIHWYDLLNNLLFSDIPYTASRFVSESFGARLTGLLRENRFDVVQLEGLYLISYADLIRKNSKALISLRAHNIEHEIWERNAVTEANILRKIYFRKLAKRIRQYEYAALGRFDLLVPITNRDLEKFNKMGNLRPAHVCRAGVDIAISNHGGAKSDCRQSEESADRFSLYFLGSLDWIPNQEGLIWFVSKVLPRLLILHPDLKLHVAGRNAPESLLKRITVPGVIFHGEVDDSVCFAKSHTVLVSPCFAGSGIRLKNIEAMGLGKAVVTTSIGAEGLEANNGVNILIADHASEFQQCIERLIEYPELCRQIGEQAQVFVQENFNNEKIAAALIDFYKQHLQ